MDAKNPNVIPAFIAGIQNDAGQNRRCRLA